MKEPYEKCSGSAEMCGDGRAVGALGNHHDVQLNVLDGQLRSKVLFEASQSQLVGQLQSQLWNGANYFAKNFEVRNSPDNGQLENQLLQPTT